ncbi:MAG: amino acid ABC transporter substrate-binding protein [Bacteroidales bacterium]|nr:amino acid ABC transporter substrate-binding protein [Bacteroidales bacterium]
MRRNLIALLILALALPFNACAQWYLFPGGRPAKDSTAKASRQDSVVVKVVPDSTFHIAADTTHVAVDSTLVAVDSMAFTVPSIPETRISLILPFKSTDTPNSNFLDFYCGALMAANLLSSDEMHYRIDVFDSTVELPSGPQLDSSDLIIGPVNMEDVLRILPECGNKYLISPLDPKVAPLSERYNIIQAPSGWDTQADELARWLIEDIRGGDSVVLLQSPGDNGREFSSGMTAALKEHGVIFSTGSSPSAWEDKVSGTCRFVLASDNDEFCSSAVREIALMNIRGGHNILYSTSRIRGLADLETESLHAAAARITATYYADPGNIAVRSFSENYKSMFKGEPSQWSFQGYDLMYYFGGLAGKNPGMWQEELAATPGQGLQTDFNFNFSGKKNIAVRRLKYNANNTITIIK